ncbi:MAG: MerR family transcriptional regulator [Deltaproteobacteria bacterium]|nr:MAG: MerR family transcriptional regulator [Deltaproteobacteria bacterium]TNF31710.1 MAG: MerR family transcriptional regulator [Deltaproteobacteria bacterium]
MASIEIPNKSLFKLNEVCGLTGVKPYVLRFWESEFEEIEPVTSSSGQKLYEHKDIEAIAIIKKLLFEDKMTIEQAKAQMLMVYSKSTEDDVELPEIPDLPSAPKAVREIKDSDIQKLVMAKSKLNGLLHMAENLKNRHQW